MKNPASEFFSYVYNLFLNCHMELADNHSAVCKKYYHGSFHPSKVNIAQLL